MKTVYYFPNGFLNQAENTYGWLRNYNLNPVWGKFDGGYKINLSDSDYECLLKMADYNPARWMTSKDIKETVSMYPIL